MAYGRVRTIEFIEFLNKFAFNSFVKFGQITFNCPNEIKRENTEAENRSLIENELLIIGCGLNGDPIVIDIKDGKMGYISHDELWEDEEIAVSEVYVKMNESIGSFFLKSANSSNYPVDYFEALEFEAKNV